MTSRRGKIWLRWQNRNRNSAPLPECLVTYNSRRRKTIKGVHLLARKLSQGTELDDCLLAQGRRTAGPVSQRRLLCKALQGILVQDEEWKAGLLRGAGHVLDHFLKAESSNKITANHVEGGGQQISRHRSVDASLSKTGETYRVKSKTQYDENGRRPRFP